ncbi:MAG TPA: hypothetical protein PLZ58_02445 [Candidatus Saccharibacteria bacterium]|nr:hypothetical protein [Candidatus Saccharibacteria bacterium]HRQ06636.1 hypothetical protein [Candidatus Saccharibacteria bacterium]
MSSAAEILVIILSVFLAIFLALAITLTIYLIVLTKQIRRVTKSAERTVGHIESTVSGISKVTSPLFVAEIIGRYIKKFKKSASKSKKGE